MKSELVMIASPETPRNTAEEWAQFRTMVAHGILFLVVGWIDQGKPTLRPENKNTPIIGFEFSSEFSRKTSYASPQN